ncbi:MAG: hypothetical protein SFU56_01310 [Capsulimonadales bacterium]|nr:hypothetical protein [Capsulimonadales bacterium]
MARFSIVGPPLRLSFPNGQYRGTLRFPPEPGKDPPPPDGSGPSSDGLSPVHLLAGSMGCLTFVMLILVVILWHSPIAAQ